MGAKGLAMKKRRGYNTFERLILEDLRFISAIRPNPEKKNMKKMHLRG
jgi:hypothetical protein